VGRAPPRTHDEGLRSREALVLGHLPAVPGPRPPRNAHRHVVLAAHLFWKPNAGVSKPERKWLNEKYPAGKTAGASCGTRSSPTSTAARCADLPETLPALCNITQLPLRLGLDRHHLKMYTSEYKGACTTSTPTCRSGFRQRARTLPGTPTWSIVSCWARSADESGRRPAMDGHHARSDGRRRVRLSLGCD